MTSPQSLTGSGVSSDDLLTVGTEALLASAERLGLKWGLRPATVSSGVDPTSVVLTLDGDSVLVNAYSLVGPVANGARVMVMSVPPSGLYIIGHTGTQTISNSNVYRYIPTSPQSVTGTTLTTLAGSTFSFTKVASYSALDLRICTEGRASTAGATYAGVVAATFNSTAFEVTTLFFNTADVHMAFSHDFRATGLAAGDYTIVLQARASAAGKTYVTDQNDLTTLHVTEVF